MKWVWMMPFVDQPQTQNDRKSAQNAHRRDAAVRTRMAVRAGETPVAGTVTGTYAATTASDNVRESIQEVLTKGGNPSSRYSYLEHRWTVNVTAGSRIELHVEGFRTQSSDGDDFRFEWSTDGTNFTDAGLPSLPTSDNDTDVQAVLPSNLSGPITIRVVDTNHAAGGQSLDTVSIDELFVRSVP